MAILFTRDDLTLVYEATINAGGVFPTGQPLYKTANYEDPEGFLYIEGDGAYGDIEVRLTFTELGPVQKTIRLDGQKGITQIRAGVEGLRYFELFNASAGQRTPKIYKYRGK